MKQNLDHGTFLSFTKLCQKGQLVEAFQFVDLLYRQRFPISTNVFYPLLQGCINNKDLQAGKEVHGMIMNCGLDSNVFLGSHLIRMFALCGSLLDAKSVFSRLPTPDVFTWGAIITAHAKLGQPEQAIELYHLMRHQSQVKPDAHIFVAVLKACSSTTASDEDCWSGIWLRGIQSSQGIFSMVKMRGLFNFSLKCKRKALSQIMSPLSAL